MATKSFLKSVDIRNPKQTRNIAHAIAKSEAFVKKTPYREEPAKVLSRDAIKKYFSKEGYVECEDTPALLKFYESNGFRAFTCEH